MPENSMGIESESTLIDKTQIEYDNKSSFTGEDIDRMRGTPVLGGGSQLDHLGEFSKYPRPPIPTNIDYNNTSSFTGEDIERMKNTPVVGGGNQLEHLGESSPYPIPDKIGFLNRVDRWFKGLVRRGNDIPNTISDANQLISQYGIAEELGDKGTQANIIKTVDADLARMSAPIPARTNKKR